MLVRTREQMLARRFFHLGCHMLGLHNKGLSERSKASKFRDNFKWGPGRLAFLFVRIKNSIYLRGLVRQYEPKHLLWTFYFLSGYVTERRMAVALRDGDRKTMRKVYWATIQAIAALVPHFIRFENRKRGARRNAYVHTSVDCTDYCTLDWGPFDKRRFTYKFHGAGLRYEIALSVEGCDIVHILGPFLPGEYNDLTIARVRYHRILPRGEYYFADGGYRCKNGPIVTFDMLQTAEQQERFRRIRGRHETINRRFKEWGILGQKYRHSEWLHSDVFKCIAVLVQIDISCGRNVWHV